MLYQLRIVINPKTRKVELFNEITDNVLIRHPKELYTRYSKNGVLDDIIQYYKDIPGNELAVTNFDLEILERLIKELSK